MNRCTQLDEILREHVPRQPLEAYWISRSTVNGHMFCLHYTAWSSWPLFMKRCTG